MHVIDPPELLLDELLDEELLEELLEDELLDDELLEEDELELDELLDEELLVLSVGPPQAAISAASKPIEQHFIVLLTLS